MNREQRRRAYREARRQRVMRSQRKQAALVFAVAALISSLMTAAMMAGGLV